ncbi:IS110 family transposase [Cohnella sp. LGH]|uniref:IS110 family transposase n=1 Tax=Cohnella sp. LGH TaxID=1619153 RepID=UPI00353040C7
MGRTHTKERGTIYDKRNTAYVGIDMHKETHTAVVIDCWMNDLGHITFENRPNAFDSFVLKVKAMCGKLLVGHKYTVKTVNPAYTHAVRLSAPTVHKNDDYDAYCIARILRDMLDKLPDADQPDIFWTIRQFVKRRDSLSKRYSILQNQLHAQLTSSYSSYRKFFSELDGKAALTFWESYPSPSKLWAETAESLAAKLREASRNACSTRKAEQILELVKQDGHLSRDFQTERDFITSNIVKELRHTGEQRDAVDDELRKLLPLTGYQLETMPGINLITAARLTSEIGDINRFPKADKLARFSGVAPVWFSTAGKGKEQRSRQGNRELHGIFYFLAVQLVVISKGGKARHPVFRDYFDRKVQEGKTKPQALVCVMRRAVNVIYGMMKNKTAYVPYEKHED